MTVTLQKHTHWWKRLSPSKFTSHYSWGTNRVCEYKMDLKVYMDSYMASNGSCFMVTWTTFKIHLLEVGLTQTRETMALRMLTTVGLFYFNLCEDPHELKFIELAFGWGPGHVWLRTTLRSMTTLHEFGGVLGRPLLTFFWAGSHNFMVTALGSCVKWPLSIQCPWDF